MKKSLIAVFFVLLFSGCDSNSDCDDLLCTSPPPTFAFELVDEETSENLFTNGTLSNDDIRILNENDEEMDYFFVPEEDQNIIVTVLWETSITDYRIVVGGDLEIDFHVRIQQKTGNCCAFFEVSEFSIEDYQFEQPTNTGLIRVFI